MKVGYSRLRSLGVCDARSVARDGRDDFRCLEKALEWSYHRGFLFFRLHQAFLPHQLGSERVSPLGEWIQKRGMRVVVRFATPDYNTPDGESFRNATALLLRTALFLDALGLDYTHKIQVPVPIGAGALERSLSLRRFDDRYRLLPEPLQRRLVIETSAGRLGLRDCLAIWAIIGTPVVYRSEAVSPDVVETALARSAATWAADDGTPIVDCCAAAAPIDALLERAAEADYMFESNGLPAALRARASAAVTSNPAH